MVPGTIWRTGLSLSAYFCTNASDNRKLGTDLISPDSRSWAGRNPGSDGLRVPVHVLGCLLRAERAVGAGFEPSKFWNALNPEPKSSF